MFDARLMQRPRLPIRLKWVVLGWLLAEIAVAVLLVRGIGLGPTLLLALATSVLGVVLLRRLGISALAGLRDAPGGRRPPPGPFLDGMLGGLAALLLIQPGFLGSVAGLALASPSLRARAIGRFGGAPGPARPSHRPPPGVIDLEPEDWRPVDRG